MRTNRLISLEALDKAARLSHCVDECGRENSTLGIREPPERRRSTDFQDVWQAPGCITLCRYAVPPPADP